MLRMLLTAFATAQAASKARQIAQHTAYGIVAIGAVLIALVFGAMALFFYLGQFMNSASAAAIVALASAALAGIIALYARWKDSQVEEEDIFEQFGLPNLGISSQKDVEAVADAARTQIRRLGPINVALAALAAGFLLGRRT